MLVGASGGVAGLTGAATRVMFQPIVVGRDPETGEPAQRGGRGGGDPVRRDRPAGAREAETRRRLDATRLIVFGGAATAASVLEQYPTLKVMIVGHTDSAGSDSYNGLQMTVTAASDTEITYTASDTPMITLCISTWSRNMRTDCTSPVTRLKIELEP